MNLSHRVGHFLNKVLAPRRTRLVIALVALYVLVVLIDHYDIGQ